MARKRARKVGHIPDVPAPTLPAKPMPEVPTRSAEPGAGTSTIGPVGPAAHIGARASLHRAKLRLMELLAGRSGGPSLESKWGRSLLVHSAATHNRGGSPDPGPRGVKNPRLQTKVAMLQSAPLALLYFARRGWFVSDHGSTQDDGLQNATATETIWSLATSLLTPLRRAFEPNL